ncbi:Coenzyme F420 hydrogenase/dehydrogenase, beta subunit C-terminal domain [Luteolibacter marinus]|uniref:Coenzyme F420 hydrogenase/dehydrogenase, beta subunit C-terminal domain n=1 Tax=Luteolibacter marinus TaxID=2776705 RepID=UPI001867696A
MTDGGELKKVVVGGYCVGCGACAALDPAIQMRFDDMQRLGAVLPVDRKPSLAAAQSCPFGDGNPDEDEIAQGLYADPEIRQDQRIGRHLKTFGGWVEEGAFRERASSGGIGTWLQCELLSKGLVDSVLNVAEVDVAGGEAPLFSFTVARTRDEVVANAKTRYYPIEMSEVLRFVLETPGRYAVIGVPCFCKALRLATRQSPELADRLHFVLGIVCGHLKSGAFADSLAWQCGITPDELTGIDFRSKLAARPASRYGVTVEGLRDGEPITLTRPMEGLVGANWGHGLFKYKACEFCDDVLAETADAVVGDAWLPEYDGDHRGANVVIARSRTILELLEAGAREGRLRLDMLTADQVAASQAGGLRHRRDGLRYRLKMVDDQGDWRPRKRVEPGADHLSPSLRKIHRLRFELGQKSHAAFEQARKSGDLNEFLGVMSPLIAHYESHMHPSLFRRCVNFSLRKVLALRARFSRA